MIGGGVIICALAIFMMVMIPALGWTFLGIVLTLAIVMAIWFFWWRKKHNRSLRSLLPTSAQQARDVSNTPHVPNVNPPAFTAYDESSGSESIVLQPPPLAVMQSIDNHGSDVGCPVTHPVSPTLLPMHMDSADGWKNCPLWMVHCQLDVDQTKYIHSSCRRYPKKTSGSHVTKVPILNTFSSIQSSYLSYSYELLISHLSWFLLICLLSYLIVATCFIINSDK